VLLSPALGRSRLPRGFASVVPVAAILLTTAALVSPAARDHASGAHGHGAEGEAAAGHHAVDDGGLSLLTNGHHEEIVQHELPPSLQTELNAQLDVTRQVAERLPTVADAEAAGYIRAGPFSPGLGTHYVLTTPEGLNFDGMMNYADLQNPLSIIYDGSAPDSPVAGFMYYATTGQAPDGFAGPNDVWHYHETVCVSYGADGISAPFGADLPVTEEQCSAVGGSLIESTQYMVHVWTVPGYDDVPGGVFAEVNPALDCSDGTYHRIPQSEWPTHLVNVCASGAA
jgi:hypothetical protein